MEILFTDPITAYDKFKLLAGLGAAAGLMAALLGRNSRGRHAFNYLAGFLFFALFSGAAYWSHLDVFYKLQTADGRVELHYVFPRGKVVTLDESITFKFSPARGGCRLIAYHSDGKHRSSESRNADCKAVARSLSRRTQS